MQFAKNKKAFHDYEILQKFEAGIVLNGDEVKSIRNKDMNLKGSFVHIKNDEAFMEGAHISRYEWSSRQEHNPTRSRKLILHKKEIKKIETVLNEQGITCVPLSLYSKKGLIKAEIALVRGKKVHDKRETIKRKDQDLDTRRALKNFS